MIPASAREVGTGPARRRLISALLAALLRGGPSQYATRGCDLRRYL